MKNFIPTQPIYVGFCGPAGSGKTSTAKKIVPGITVSLLSDPSSFPDVIWGHHWLSQPLYEMASTLTELYGEELTDRKLYALHDIVNSIMMKRIPYDDLVELVYDIYHMPVDNYDGQKPRTFLQTVGDMCRNQYEDCFSNYVKYKIYNTYRSECIEYDRHDQDEPWYIGIVEDVRTVREAKMIKDQPNNILIKFTASPAVLRDRLLNRDGVDLAPEQASHRTENEFNGIPDEDFDLILDTDSLSVDDQAEVVYDYITNNHNFGEKLNG